MRDVVAHAQAPRGSLQHYFPGGKQQLVSEAVDWAGRYAGNRVARFLAEISEPSPSRLFAAMVHQRTEEFETVGFASGCPVAAATVDCADSAESTRAAAADSFGRRTRPVARAQGSGLLAVAADQSSAVNRAGAVDGDVVRVLAPDEAVVPVAVGEVLVVVARPRLRRVVAAAARGCGREDGGVLGEVQPDNACRRIE